jgi:hypothetical protein
VRNSYLSKVNLHAMAKSKISRKKAAKKTPAANRSRTKKTPASTKKTFATEGPLPPKQRKKALSKLRKLSIRPSHPSSMTGPAMELGYDAPLPKKTRSRKRSVKPAKRKR